MSDDIKKLGVAKKFRVGQLAPEALRDLPKPSDEAHTIGASSVTSVARAMFGKPKPAAITAAVAVQSKPVAAAAPPAKSARAVVKPSVEEKTDFEEITGLTDELKEMGKLILEGESKDLYSSTVPTAYVPQTRRGFSEFIKATYTTFELPAGPITIPEGEKYYPYQKFVRDYMRTESPYRGILVYHGLGSGKTCTAIAASEALYASAHKKIIVMTPFSLKKNFLKEVSFCGFRHFQLNNFWIPLSIKDATTTIFANQILGISAKYLKTARNVWVPDFRKPQSESNYSSLNDEDRSEIRRQILSIVEWHPEKNPSGRIRFIAYNGISAKKLLAIACETGANKFFDNAVIVVDEIHNLIRLMHGKIEPYLTRLDEPEPGKKRGRRRTVPVESITPNRWKPSICNQDTKLYTRGYLFYRLLLDAQNSRIVGLSGTPLINFPEELGILSNVLHGYIATAEGVIQQVGSDIQKKAEQIGLSQAFTDFVKAKPDPAGGGTRVLFSFLPHGIRKIENDIGVVRISEEDVKPTFEEILDSLRAAYETAGIPFSGKFEVKSEELLPPFGTQFSEKFMGNNGLKNKAVLITRLTGLISFYKGSRLELMPRVKSDEIVRVPFSTYAQKAYSFKRSSEVQQEKGAIKGVDAVWAKVYEMGDSASANNYKMGSRQACNFAFPSDVIRPSANLKDRKEEAEDGVISSELIALAPDADAEGERTDEYTMELGDDRGEMEDAEKAARQDDAVLGEEEEGGEQEGGATYGYGEDHNNDNNNNDDDDDDEKQEGGATYGYGEDHNNDNNNDDDDEKQEGGATYGYGEDHNNNDKNNENKNKNNNNKNNHDGGGKTIAEIRAAAADCKTGTKPGEKYKDACNRAKQCLKTIAKARMTLAGTDGLKNYSAKYAAMLEKINAAPGSSLVYSQFLDMEGIGIFRVAMDVNGFAPIEITNIGGTIAFSKATEESLRKGPGKQPRYMTFSGGEDQEVRRAALDVFNARFAELPESMNKILGESGYTDNKVGELCRVFCITSAGAEGLSLRNVRAVHIMEPYWNEVRLRQVKGRAIRIGSHLDLPEDQRDVSIYTYISCFSEAAQRERVGDIKIDETLLINDSVDAKVAKDMNLPIKPGMTTYVLTTDEMIYTISERKRKIIEALECIMKTASVDCELSYKQNNDRTFRCLPLKGKVGDFMYHPRLEDDILEGSKFEGEDTICTGTVKPRELYQKINKIAYRLQEILGADNEVTGYDVFEVDQLDPKKKIPDNKLGTVGVRTVDGVTKPGPPINITPVVK